MTIEYIQKSVGFALKNHDVVKSDGGEFFEFVGYGSTFQVDSDMDQILPGAFSESLKNELPALLWSHDRSQPAIGIVTEAKEDGYGLMIRGRMPMADTRVATMLKPQMQLGSIDHMSIGFRIKKYEILSEPEPGQANRLIKDLELMEISLVNRNFAANDGARITALEKELKMLKSAKMLDKNNENEIMGLLDICDILKTVI